MNLAWLYPLGLAGLAALLVPLLLHLARRREQRVLRFAAMRWLPAGRAPRRRLRLQERRLLALRLLLLAVAALWLAQPLLQDFGTPRRWLAVAPSVDPAAAHRIASDFDRAVWLAPGLPPLAGPHPGDADASGDTSPSSDTDAPADVETASAQTNGSTNASASWPSLLQEFAARLPEEDTATVLVPNVTGLGEQLPTLWQALDWREAPADEPADVAAPQRQLALRYTAADSPALPWLRTAIAAWDKDPLLRVRLDDAPASTPIPPQADALLWAGPLHDRVALPAIPQVHFPGPPSLSALYEPDFPRRLHATLFGTAPPRRVPSTLLRELPVAVPVEREGDPALSPRGLRELELSPLLAWLLLALFLLERWFASGRRLERVP